MIDGLVDGRVFHHQRVGVAERQEGTELERGVRMRVYERIADKNAVLMGDEHFLLRQYHAAHAVQYARNHLAAVFPDVLVTVRTERRRSVLVQSQVELSAVLYYCLVER